MSDRNDTITVSDPITKGAQLPSHTVGADSNAFFAPLERANEPQSQIGAKIDFGFMYSESAMMVKYSSRMQDVELVVDLTKKAIEINFNIGVSQQSVVTELGRYRLQLKIDNLRSVLVEASSEAEVFIFPLESPPELYRRASDVGSTHHENATAWSEWDALMRQTNVVLDRQGLTCRPLSLQREDAVIDIGMC